MVIADKYRFYVEEVRKKKLSKGFNKDAINFDKVIYLTKEFHEKTPEGEVLDELNIKKMCCRRHFLTHVDIE
jgi:DNA-directed RNA polymerase subunit N (RpoN/RPB10)